MKLKPLIIPLTRNDLFSKLELNSINELLINYGLDNIDRENIEISLNELAIKHDCEINKLDIDKENNMITITLSNKYNLQLFKNKLYKLNSTYKGRLDDNNKHIERKS